MRLPPPRPPGAALLLALALLVVWPVTPASSLAAPPDGRVETTAAGVWPLRPQPEVVLRFDPPASPWAAGHRGVDLAGRAGQAVRAALSGRVSYAAPLAGRGVVVVDHGDTRTTYEPVRADVVVGDRVAAGDRLGALEAPGSHCAPDVCLHWGWIRGDVYLDPLRLVGLGPVRLLPLDGARPPLATRARLQAPTGRGGRGAERWWPGQARGWAWW
jgi:murein DD-endopeptidase MepM/ murein hydrolase activator NlpD